MRDRGLSEAIRAVGSVSELARQLGISQPSVSNWARVPAERVVAVETITGISRAVLRPDLYGENETPAGIDDVDVARAHKYALLAALLARAPDAALLERLASLRGDDSPFGQVYNALAEAARDTTPEQVESEYFALFIGVGRGELLPYASYYLTGFLLERPLARLRTDLQEIGIERADDIVEPEDHAAILCEIMSALISGQLDAPAGSHHQLFEKHLKPWMGRFFGDLENAKAAQFYKPVGKLGRMFVEIEAEAFALPG